MSTEELNFGDAHGSFHGVVAYSNLNDGFFSGEKHFVSRLYTGYKYQCVEYARRYMLTVKACQFQECFRAAEIFAFTEVTNVETGEVRPFFSFANGKSATKPVPGNVIVYPWDPVKMPVGHVAIISAVGDDWVGIAEQNENFVSWGGLPYGRKVPLHQDKETGFWTIQEDDPEFENCSGWMAPDFPDRPNTSAPLVPLEKFCISEEPPSFTRTRTAKLSDEVKLERSNWTYPTLNMETDAERAVAASIEAKGETTLGKFKTILYPNERAGVGCIGCCNGGLRAIHQAMVLMFDGFLAKSTGATTQAWLSTQYNIPAEYGAALTKSWSAFGHKSLQGFGRIEIGFNANKEHRVYAVNLDSIENQAITAVFQQRLCVENGHKEGWTSGIKQDLARFMSMVCPKEDEDILYFLDFGPIASVGDKAQNEVDRAAVLHMYSTIGDEQKKCARKVGLDDLDVAPNGSVVEKSTGKALRLVYKTCSWAILFQLVELAKNNNSPHDAIVAKLFSAAALESGSVTVLPHLYTAITATPQFYVDVTKVLRTRDASTLTEAQQESAVFIPDDLTAAEAEFKSGDQPAFTIRCNGFPLNGYWSSGFMSEKKAAGGTVWTPCAFRYSMGKPPPDHEADPEE